jgi:hypothetical protein
MGKKNLFICAASLLQLCWNFSAGRLSNYADATQYALYNLTPFIKYSFLKCVILIKNLPINERWSLFEVQIKVCAGLFQLKSVNSFFTSVIF